MTSLLTIHVAWSAEHAASFGLFGRDLRAGMLLVALLLCFLLLSRVHGRTSRVRRVQRTRHSPITADELARTVFSTAVGCDLEGYRGLFLTGGEVAAVFGDQGADYLAALRPEILEESLATTGAYLSQGGRYRGVRRDAGDRLFMKVARGGGGEFEIDLGTVAQVGAILRLVEPPYRR